MSRLVGNCFKAIMFSIIFVFVFDMAFYLYRTMSLNQRMESIMTYMQEIVMENNYLPDGDKMMFDAIFRQMGTDMNRGDVFIVHLGYNYGCNAKNINGTLLTSLPASKYTSTGRRTVDLINLDTSRPADYGDIMVVQARVIIRQPIWNWVNAVDDYRYDGTGVNASDWQRVMDDSYSTELDYTYYVPCLKYQSITR